MKDFPEPISPELEKKLANVDMEVRKHLQDLNLQDLWWELARTWQLDLDEVEEMLPVSLLRAEQHLQRAVEVVAGASDAARDILGHANVYGGQQRDFGVLFGLALGQLVTIARTYPPDGNRPTLAEILTPAQVLECWFGASQVLDQFVRHPAQNEETLNEVDAIVSRKVFGPARK